MKKLSCIILALSLLLSVIPLSYASEYASFSDDQLKKQFDSIRNELAIRGYIAENKKLLIDTEVYQIYIDGDITFEKVNTWDDAVSMIIPIVMVNNSDDVVSAYIDDASINGWQISGSCFVLDLPARKKARDRIIFNQFSLERAGVTGKDDFTDAEFRIRVADKHYKNVYQSEPITIVLP